jgi:hypothetical protein
VKKIIAHKKAAPNMGRLSLFIKSLKPLLLLNLERIVEAGTIGIITRDNQQPVTGI